MCMDPVTATMAAAAVVSGAGAYFKDSNEAAVAGANSRAALAAGDANEANFRNDARLKMASQLAELSDRGQSVSTGTPLDLMATTAKNQELDALQIRANAQNQANIYKFQEKSLNAAAPFSAAGQLLMGGSKLAELGKI